MKMTDNMTTSRVVRTVRENLNLLLTDEIAREFLGDNPILVAYKKDTSLKTNIIYSRSPSNDVGVER